MRLQALSDAINTCMAKLKKPQIGVYGPNTRYLQKRLSYERISLNWKTVLVWKYEGDRTQTLPDVTDLPSGFFPEIPDRAYETKPVEINGDWDPFQEDRLDLSQFGYISPLGDTMDFRFHSFSFESNGLGRYIVVGDVLEVPFLEKDDEKAYFEVTSVDRNKEHETYEVFVTAVPMNDRQETEEIPNQSSSQTLLDDLMSGLDDHWDEEVSQDGYDTTGVQVDDEEGDPAPEYDPRSDDEADFLDNASDPVY